MLDTYQSAGTVPIDVTELGVDLLVGGSVKWLLGGPGTGYLYVRPEVAAGLAPWLVGWFGHERPFAFAPSPIALAGGAGRFVTGTPNVAAHAMAAEGYRLVAEAGVEAIRAKSRRQVARLLDGFQAQGAVVRGPADPARRGGSVVVDFDGAEAATEQLIARGYTCDYRPGTGLRLGPSTPPTTSATRWWPRWRRSAAYRPASFSLVVACSWTRPGRPRPLPLRAPESRGRNSLTPGWAGSGGRGGPGAPLEAVGQLDEGGSDQRRPMKLTPTGSSPNENPAGTVMLG